MVGVIDLHIADKTMVIKSRNYCISFISTVWCGEVIMCCYNNISEKMMSVFSNQLVNNSDLLSLESLIKKKFFIDKK